MIDILSQLLVGFHAAFTPINILFIAFGISLGIIIGVIPGLGSVTAIAVLIPLTFYMSPVVAIAFLVGVNKGGTSGGAVPSILLNTPGTPESAASAFDGYPMARKGQAGKAMKYALYSSVTGDTLSDMLLILLAAPFAALALQFGPLELTAVFFFAFALLAGLASDSPIKGLLAIFLGVFLATIGLDPIDSSPRMVFGRVELFDGLPLVAVAIGGLALSSVMLQMTELWRKGDTHVRHDTLETDRALNRLTPREFFGYWRTILRSAAIGSGVGMLPGLGVTLAAFLSYGAARRASKDPASFGKGNPEGIIATEAANSAVVGSNLIPTIAIGIPGNIAAALLIGAFMIHGIVPGPFMLTMHGDVIYALFASMLIANVVHLIIGRAGIGIWSWVARAPRSAVLPPVIVMGIAGVYLPNQSLFEIGIMLAFAVLGVLMRYTGFSIVCLVIGFLLGSMLESSLRKALLLSRGDLTAVFSSPIAMIFFAIGLFVLIRAFRRS
ncbi:MAG: tripartite tricarboxylate transporter permease [Brucellaceae bacterium]|nr:tripartite tricarboxylate transporter permease [Brucellaceae bacterium]